MPELVYGVASPAYTTAALGEHFTRYIYHGIDDGQTELEMGLVASKLIFTTPPEAPRRQPRTTPMTATGTWPTSIIDSGSQGGCIRCCVRTSEPTTTRVA